MSCLAVRIGTFYDPEQLQETRNPGLQKSFVAKEDLADLLHLAIDAPDDILFQVFHGQSDNAEPRIDIESTKKELDYTPKHAAVRAELAEK